MNNNVLLIKSGKVITMNGKIHEKIDILIENGKIIEINENINKNCKTINANGLTVLPGFIEAHSHLGIEEPNNENPGNLNEISSPITPYLNALDGINFYDKSFSRALKTGITTVVTGPGSANVLGGTFSIVKTYGNSPFDMIYKEKSSMKAALGENPKRIHSSKGRSPVTKMAIAYMLRDTLNKTISYKKSKEKNKDGFEENKTYEELIPVIEREMPLTIHVHRADDIVTALRVGEEYNLKLQLLHVTEGMKLINEIKDRNVVTIIGPIMNFSNKVETREKNLYLPGELIKNGILTAISTDHPVTPIEYLPLSAALCVKEGMHYINALESITINPAKILGIDKELGSIEVGKVADIVIIEGTPLEAMSRVKYVIGKGKIVYEV